MQLGDKRNIFPNKGFTSDESCLDKPLRNNTPERTINGNREGIICLYQVVSPVFTKKELLIGLVNNRNINSIPVISGRY